MNLCSICHTYVLDSREVYNCPECGDTVCYDCIKECKCCGVMLCLNCYKRHKES